MNTSRPPWTTTTARREPDREHVRQHAREGGVMARSLRVIGPGPGGAGWDGSQGREGARRFGAYLRRLRRQRKKSLEVISGLAGMSLPTLHRTEWGKRDVTVVEVVALARALDCSVVELAGVALGAVVAPSAEAERRRR